MGRHRRAVPLSVPPLKWAGGEKRWQVCHTCGPFWLTHTKMRLVEPFAGRNFAGDRWASLPDRAALVNDANPPSS